MTLPTNEDSSHQPEIAKGRNEPVDEPENEQSLESEPENEPAEDPDPHHYHNPGGHHNSRQETYLYSFPKQRQRWGDAQQHPHTNWGDIFFDLFYVAGAYNLGVLLREDPTWTGLLYLSALFLPLMNVWALKTYYDARFYVSSDYFHRFYEISMILILATAVLHIRPIDKMANVLQHNDLFIYSLMIVLSMVLAMGRGLEIMWCQKFSKKQKGLFPEAFEACRRDLSTTMIIFSFFVAALVYTGVKFYGSSATTSTGSAGAAYGNATEHDTNVTSYNNHRGLASYGDDEKADVDYVAIWLLLGGVFASIARFLIMILYFVEVAGNHKEVSVPVNIDFVIHRYGEWIMLMLGESVLSLLIVGVVDDVGFYQTFLGGIISIVLLEYLHFQSQPHNPDEHAMRRSLYSAFVYYWGMQAYSLALIILGTSYKMLLFEHIYEAEEGDHRFLLQGLRHLAGGESAALRFSDEDRQARIAHFFSGSLVAVFFFMDVIALSHKGLGANWKRCECKQSKIKHYVALFLLVLRFGVYALSATVSQITTDPGTIAVIGLFLILVQLCLTSFGSIVFDHDMEKREEEAIDRVILQNIARMH